MSYIILAMLFILSGFFMKYSDDLFDVNDDSTVATIFGILCGVASGLAAVSSAEAAYIFISILIGNFLVLKVDGIHHIISLITFAIILLIGGIPNLSIAVLLFCILAIVSDEVGHELIGNFTQDRFLNFFFEYRFVMKIVVLLLAVCGVFDIWTFVCFLMFEIAYVFGGIVFERFN